MKLTYLSTPKSFFFFFFLILFIWKMKNQYFLHNQLLLKAPVLYFYMLSRHFHEVHSMMYLNSSTSSFFFFLDVHIRFIHKRKLIISFFFPQPAIPLFLPRKLLPSSDLLQWTSVYLFIWHHIELRFFLILLVNMQGNIGFQE